MKLLCLMITFTLLNIAMSNPEECEKEAQLYVDGSYAKKLCKTATSRFMPCARYVKEKINEAPIMYDTDIERCAKVQAGFVDCYESAVESLDRDYTFELCYKAKNGFRNCLNKRLKQEEFPIPTDDDIKACLNSEIIERV